MATVNTSTKVVTSKVRFSYANVFEPSAMEGSDPKYSVVLLIPKSDTVTVERIKAAISAALENSKSKLFGGKIPMEYKSPLRDGDLKTDHPEYAGHWFINAKSDSQPGIVDKALNPIIDRNDFYSGCFGRASVNFFGYNKSGNKGVGCALLNLQKLEDGERLSGVASSPELDFGDSDDLL